MSWFQRKCPVRAEEQEWVERSMHWLRAQFGTAALYRDVLLPAAELFPHPYDGTPANAREVLGLVCHQMDLDPDDVDLELMVDDATAERPDHTPAAGTVITGALAGWSRGGSYAARSLVSGCDDAATRYRPGSSPARVAVSSDLAHRPLLLLAALAHQVGHVRLLREQRVTAGQRDHEPLADLLSVFFGLGIFAANAAVEFFNRNSGFQTYRLGYLTEPMLGYALAYYAWLRGEPRPHWLDHLDINPKVFAKRGLKYLRSRDSTADRSSLKFD